MFNNPGGKIKSYAKVIFWIGAVISIIVGVVIIAGSFIQASYYGSVGSVFGGIVEGIIATAIGILISWISVLTLYAFGVLVENSDELVRINGGKPSGEKSAEKVQLPKNTHEFVQEMAPVEKPTTQETKVCPSCGTPINDGAHFCKNCGTKID